MRKLCTILLLVSLTLGCRLFSPVPQGTDSPAGNAPCVETNPGINPAITLDGLYAEYSGETEVANGITAYLNTGAAVDQLQGRLTDIQTGSSTKIKAQVQEQELTGDAIPDVVVSLALPAIPGYGDAILAVYTCQSGRYVRQSVFGRVGAGGRGEGLYDSGGACIVQVTDLNADGQGELVFHLASLNELYLASWDGADFASLVETYDELGNPQAYIPARDGAFEIRDVDEDGVLEVVLSDPPGLWRWDGSLFQPSAE